MERITWRTQRKYFQEFNIIYSKKSPSFTDVQWIVKVLYERCKSKKEHLVGDAVHGIIVSVDNINDKKANFVKKGSQCTFRISDLPPFDHVVVMFRA